MNCQKHSFHKHDDVRRHLYCSGFCNTSMSCARHSPRSWLGVIEPMSGVEIENPHATMVRDAFYSNFNSNVNCDKESMFRERELSSRATRFFLY